MMQSSKSLCYVWRILITGALLISISHINTVEQRGAEGVAFIE